MVTKLFRSEILDFQARRQRQEKMFEPQQDYGEKLFAMSDEAAAEKLKLQQE